MYENEGGFGGRRGGFGGASGGRGFDRGPREMSKAVCTECGAECEVPFKPTEGKPVYCRDCWQKKRGF
jgi:CxxC-x17-CxxC domain-containing protein